MTGFWQPAFLGFASRIKMFEKFGKFTLTSVFGLWLCCGMVGLLGTERGEFGNLYEFALPSPTTYYRNKSAQCIQLRLCSSSGLCDLWAPTAFLILLSAAFPHHTITCWCYWWPSLQKDWGTIMCSQNIHTASRRQCVTKEQFLSSSKVCSKSFCKILSGLFFLYCNTLLGSS